MNPHATRLVTAAYNLLFDRNPDSEGAAFWADKISAEPGKLPEIINEMIEAAEGDDKYVIDAKRKA